MKKIVSFLIISGATVSFLLTVFIYKYVITQEFEGQQSLEMEIPDETLRLAHDMDDRTAVAEENLAQLQNRYQEMLSAEFLNATPKSPQNEAEKQKLEMFDSQKEQLLETIRQQINSADEK